MPEDRSVLIKTAYAYYQRGDWDRALEEYHKLADLDPGDLNVLNILADIYAKKGETQEALRQYDLVAQGYDQKNQVDKVLQVYKRMLKLSPSNNELQTAVKNLVQKYLDRASQLEAQEPDRAGEIYRSILKAEPNRYDASLRLAKILIKKQQKFQAVEMLLNLAESLDPATQTGRLLEALQLVVEYDPLNVEARERLAQILVTAREPVLAVENYRALMEIHISRNDLDHAQETAQKAIDLGDTEAFYHLGVIHFNQERFQESRQCFERFLQKQETHVGALKYLALTHLKLNQHQEAVQAYLRILAVYVNENLLEEAREVRQTILELDPANEAIKAFSLDGPSAAPAPAPEPPPAVPSPEDAAAAAEAQVQALSTQAQGFIEKGLYDQAIDVYLDMIKRWPERTEIKGRLQQVYALMVKPSEPEVKQPSPEEMKAELERELRAQMKDELEVQTRRLVEEQARMQLERQHELENLKKEQEAERLKMQRELEAKMLEQMRHNEEQARLQADRQRDFDRLKVEQEEERIRLKKELEDQLLEQMRKVKEDENQRERLRREYEDQQKSMVRELERLEKEKTAETDRLHREMEETRRAMEEKLRLQVEQELREKMSRESHERELREKESREREKELKERDEHVKALMRQEEEERRKFEESEKSRLKAKDNLSDEISRRMDRLRSEKEREPAAPPPHHAPAPSSQLQEVHKPISTGAQGGGMEAALEDPFVRQTLADIYAKQGLYVEALKIYERILNEDPDNEDVKEKLRDILRLKGI